MNDPNDHLMTVFSCALDCASEAERVAYLDRTCGEDPAVRAEIEALLRAHGEACGFLEPLSEFHRTTVAQADAAETVVIQPDPDLGAVLAGRYRLLEVIGEGGMGKVWRAEQIEPVQREVALKVIKPGMDSKQVLARFEVERQALALMDHANIAKVLDGGTTAEGRPFFVMELVKGVPLIEFCDQRRLTVDERLALFIEVCNAVQHAHQKGVIHRDLKPTNVLVARSDGKPVPKVIDFGIAKAMGEPLTDKTLLTGLGGIVGTPEYMSPEQAELNNNDIDTRSDIYGLGVLFYELLTGTPPLLRERTKETPLLEVLRVVRDEEPPRPSTRIAMADDLPTIAANRGQEPRQLSRLVRGELDWIAMKALEKDRTRRYDTAGAFAADVRCYLDDKPVLAHPPTRRYRLQKFARRHRTALLMTAVTGVGLLVTVAGLAASTIIIDRKQRATEFALNAEKEAKDRLATTVERERRNLYDYAFGMARRDWMAGDIDQARRNLATCPSELRDGDWDYLERVCNAEVLRLKPRATKLQFSPDGKYLAGVGPCMVWNATTGQEFLNLSLYRFAFTFAGVAYSNDGNELAIATTGEALDFAPLAGKQAEHPGFTVTVWDLVNRKQSGGFERRGLWGREVLNRDGSRVVLMPYPPNKVFMAEYAPPRSVTVCDTRSGREICTIAVPKDHLVAAVFHPEGQLLTVSGRDKVLRFWNAETGEQTRTFSLGSYLLNRVVISPDGRRLAATSLSSKERHQVKVWDLGAEREIASFSGHTGTVTILAFSPDGRQLATGGSDKAVRIWDVETGREQLTLRGHASGIADVTFSPDGRHVASSESAATGTIRVWDVRQIEAKRDP